MVRVGIRHPQEETGSIVRALFLGEPRNQTVNVEPLPFQIYWTDFNNRLHHPSPKVVSIGRDLGTNIIRPIWLRRVSPHGPPRRNGPRISTSKDLVFETPTSVGRHELVREVLSGHVRVRVQTQPDLMNSTI